jgi:tRNA pseudouridine55 synthase
VDGVLVIDKPPDYTSHDVVNRLRHILHERRIGHTGTLDPFATGVLVILIGKATRLAQFLSVVNKEYEAVIRLGYATDTGDRTGNRIAVEGLSEPAAERAGQWTAEEIELALGSLRGYIQQVPPMYSAKKRHGRKLYELAREGQKVEREPVQVCIHELEPIERHAKLIKDNFDGTFDFRVRVVCSSGTYVRTLAEDFGKRLGVGAHLAELRRTRVGKLTLANAVALEQVSTLFAEQGLGTILLNPNVALSELPFVHLSAEDERRVRHGMEVAVENVGWNNGDRVRMCDAHGELLAMGEFNDQRRSLQPRVVFAEDPGPGSQ